MPNPIKAIKGGVQGIKNTVKSVQINNQNVKNGTAVKSINGPAPTKKTMTPKAVVKSFVSGAKNPTAAKVMGKQLKSFGTK